MFHPARLSESSASYAVASKVRVFPVSGVRTKVYLVLAMSSVAAGAVKVMRPAVNVLGGVSSVQVDVGWSAPTTVHTIAAKVSPSLSA